MWHCFPSSTDEIMSQRHKTVINDCYIIGMTYKNLLEILKEAAKHPLASNRRTSVYTLPEDAFEGSADYLLRVRFFQHGHSQETRKSLLDAALAQTSSLTPVTLGTARKFSQPLFTTSFMGQTTDEDINESLEFELVHRAAGKGLEAIFDEEGEEGLRQKLAKLPNETYKNFLQQSMQWLMRHGLPSEPHNICHIFLDEDAVPPKLSIIDVLEHQHKTNPHRLGLLHTNFSLKQFGLYYYADDETKIRLEKIAREIGFPISQTEAREKVDELQRDGKICFARVRPIRSADASAPLLLSDVPFTVQLKLQRVESYNAKRGASA